MSFSAAWLDLREPHDAAARDQGLAARLRAWAQLRPAIEVIDLGSGTGSNLRWLAPYIGREQHWRLIERDPAAIQAGRVRLASEPAWAYIVGDLATGLEALVVPPVDLVTCSALLDLVSRDWLTRLVGRVRQLRAALLVALSFDGRVELHPPHPADARIIALVNRHQRSDKGFGDALGPMAIDALVELIAGPGAAAAVTRSDWRLGPADGALQGELLAGYADAALELEPGEREAIEAWLAWRLARVAAGEASALVGHRDLLWLPP